MRFSARSAAGNGISAHRIWRGYKDLFVPDSYRDEVFRFVQGNVCTKEDLGTKVTAGGLIGICNWHALAEADEDRRSR